MPLTLDGSTETFHYAEAPSPPFSVFTWFRHPGDLANHALWASSVQNESTNYFYGAWLQADEKIRFGVRDSGGVTNTHATNFFSKDVWQCSLQIVTSITSRRNVTDGDWASSGTTTTSRSPSGLDVLSVASRYDDTPANYFDGEQAGWAMWDVDLVEADSDLLAAGVSPQFISPANLIHFIPMFDTTGEDLVSTDPTVTGTPVIYSTDSPTLIYPGRRGMMGMG